MLRVVSASAHYELHKSMPVLGFKCDKLQKSSDFIHLRG